MAKTHHYETTVAWTGNLGKGTSDYRSYARDHEVTAGDKPPIPGSSDPSFRGDPTRWNPEELLVASLSQCHMLSFLHRCTVSGLVVTDYTDRAEGSMVETADGGGHLTEVVLHPEVSFADPQPSSTHVAELHERAHHLCFIANSVNFPVRCEPV